MKTNPLFPIYVPSKGRWESRLTVKALQSMGVDFFVVIEEQQYSDYAREIPKRNLLVLDMEYKRNYDTCDSLGDSRSKGPGPARNFIWQHSKANGFAWHWTMDDNIRAFYRLNRNIKAIAYTGAFFRAMEDFCLRYENIAMAGPNYEMFVPRKKKVPPFIMNTRIYSCNLIRNDVPFKWRGRYNEDTILSLDMLKAGWCTVEFNAFLQDKVANQTLKGGNTTEFYDKEGKAKKGSRYTDNGTLAKSQMQVAVYPDVSKLVWKFGRVHHHVDYSPFKHQKLIRKPDVNIQKEVNNYGMVLKKVKHE